ncbi:MAG: energy-coupling factor transporter transmembrane protein EcfT [Oscillospiraceae bacterium]
MLKDITLGQYFPGTSFVHRLDPRVKLICTLIYIVALLVAKSYVSYGVMLLLLVLSVAVSKIRPAALLKGLKPLAFIIIFTAIINLFYTKGGKEIFSWWIFTLTTGGIERACFMVIRIMMLISGTFLLTYTTTPMSLTDGMERLMNPLKKIRVPVHELSMMMSIALRFIPSLIEETDKIMSAQKARGADFETGKLTDRAKALLPLLVPLFVSAFRRADELAIAMEARCYHGGEGRTRMKTLKYKASDFITLGGFLVLLVGIIILARFGL